MKRQAYTMIAMIVLFGSMAVAAQAQTSGRTQLVANIPFQFSVGNRTLPAGEYILGVVNDDSSSVVLKIQSRDGKASAMLQMGSIEGKAEDRAKLVFRHYGNRYYFAQAWTGEGGSGLEAQKSRAERTTQRELAGIKMATESVVLTARR